MNKNAVKKNGHSVSLEIEVMIYEDHGIFVAYSPALDLSSYGSTIDDAKNAFDEAVEIFIEETESSGTLERNLLKLGWKLQLKPKPLFERPNYTLAQIRRLPASKKIFNQHYALTAY